MQRGAPCSACDAIGHWHGPLAGFCLPVPVHFATVPIELVPQRAQRALESQRALAAA